MLVYLFRVYSIIVDYFLKLITERVAVLNKEWLALYERRVHISIPCYYKSSYSLNVPQVSWKTCMIYISANSYMNMG